MDLSKLRVGHGVEEMSLSDSFVVDIEAGFSHLRERDINGNSKFSLSHSRKGTPRGGGEKKINPTATAAAAEEDASSRASLHGGSTPEKPAAVAADHAVSPRIHHQITIKKESLSSPPPASKHDSKRLGYRRSSSGRFIDPRRVLVFFATLSSMGTVLLIYFTLSIGKLNMDDNGLN